MKRTLIILIFLALAIGVNAQTNAYDGLHVGAKATKTGDSYIRRIDVNESDSTLKFYDKNGKLLNPVLNANGYLDNADYFVSLRPDTVHVTDPTYTVLATNASKVHVFYNDFTLVTIPAYATQPIPVGTWTTFISKGGKVRFTGTNVHSELDSLTINLKGAAQLFKIGQNDNLMIGGFLN